MILSKILRHGVLLSGALFALTTSGGAAIDGADRFGSPRTMDTTPSASEIVLLNRTSFPKLKVFVRIGEMFKQIADMTKNDYTIRPHLAKIELYVETPDGAEKSENFSVAAANVYMITFEGGAFSLKTR